MMLQPTNCLSVFDHFVGFALKEMISNFAAFDFYENYYVWRERVWSSMKFSFRYELSKNMKPIRAEMNF